MSSRANTTYFADLEEQALQVSKLVWGQPEQPGVVIHNTSSEVLVRRKGICVTTLMNQNRRHIMNPKLHCCDSPLARSKRVVPVSVIPEVVGKTTVPAEP